MTTAIEDEYRKAIQYLLERNDYYDALSQEGVRHEPFKTTFMTSINYSVPLAIIVNRLDPKPRENESYADRLKRILKGKKILEIGARHGIFVDFLNKHGAKAEGIDLNEVSSAIARKHGVPVETKALEDLNDNAKYDLVLSHQFFDWAYFERFRHSATPPDVQKMCDKISTALKSGGLSIHTVDKSDSIIERKNLETAGLVVESHGKKEFPFGEYHVSIARRVR
ncbi:MAG: methyltransferase domain-containing protein [Candidatus Micrarchaeota archaeon]